RHPEALRGGGRGAHRRAWRGGREARPDGRDVQRHRPRVPAAREVRLRPRPSAVLMLALDLPVETPRSAQEVCEIVAAGRPLEVVGGGTKRGIGAVAGAEAVLSLARLDKVVDYQPEELVLTAQPGVRLATLEELVAAEGQMLAFEPPRLTRLLGARGQPTLGG